MRDRQTLRVLALAAIAGCGGDDAATPDAAPRRPAVPAEADPAYVVTGAPRYLLVGDALTAATASFALSVTAPAGVPAIELWLDDATTPRPLVASAGGAWSVTVEADGLEAGDHELLLAVPGAEAGFFHGPFVKGHALYVMMSTDWDFPDVDDRVIAHHEGLHEAHPELKITHLLAPYTFTDPAVSTARRQEIAEWAKGMRTAYGDELGLHIHPRCTFVEAAGVTCRSQPSVAYPEGDDSGYTVRLGAYSNEEWDVLLAAAAEIWDAQGFGAFRSFRAGAWTLELPTAIALSDAGILVDSSAVNWRLMEEWEGYDLYDWNAAAWAPIGDTSQPYHPTEDRLLPGGAGAPLPMLEVPDNGIMVDYWTVAEITGIFDANWSGGALATPTQLSTGFHPAPSAYYSPAEFARLESFLAYADGFLASALAGPVVYITMSQAHAVW